MKIIRRYSHSFFLLCGAMLLFGVFLNINSAHAAINTQIPFYGTLNDTVGSPLTGTYDMVFRIYDSASGGTLLDTSTHTVGNGNVITVTDGEFNVLLGSGTGNALDGIDFNSSSIYVGLTVESDSEMTPRERLGSAPYSFNSDALDGLDSTEFLRTNATGTISTT